MFNAIVFSKYRKKANTVFFCKQYFFFKISCTIFV